MDQEPLCFLLGGLELIWLEGPNVKLRRINHLSVGLLKEIERELQ
jgi:hypothetical protein